MSAATIRNFLFKKIRSCTFPDDIWPLVIGTSACSLEFLAAWQECEYFHSPYSLNRFTPEQADILIVYGHVNKSMLQLVLDIEHRMSDSKKVLLVGSRTFESGCFKDTYWGGVQLADHIKVDVTVSGDPPLKDDILMGFREISRAYHLEGEKGWD